MIDLKGLADHLRSVYLTVVNEISPGGELRGSEYVSDKIIFNSATGGGVILGSGEKFNGIIDLYGKLNLITTEAAAEILAEKFKYHPPDDDAHSLKFVHKNYGSPTKIWRYYFQNSHTAFIESEYHMPDGKNTVIPYCPVADGGFSLGLNMRERPIYRLPEILAADDSKQVVVVSSASAADACQKIVGDRAIVTAWSGGNSSVQNTDFSTLRGRKVLIWPDASQSGESAGLSVKNKLFHFCGSLAIISTEGLPEGFNAKFFTGGWPELKNFVALRGKKSLCVSPETGIVDSVTVNSSVSDSDVNDSEQLDGEYAKKTSDSLEPVKLFSGSIHAVWERFGIALNTSGNPYPNIDNVARIFDRCEEFKKNIWYDEFYKRYYTSFGCQPRAWTNIDDYDFTQKIQREFGIHAINDKIVNCAMRLFAHRNKRCEPTDWLNSLSWDGVTRIDTLFPVTVACVDNEYSRAISRNFMLSMVARLLRPGCKHDTMVILEGAEGRRKSSFFEAVAGKKWYTQAIESVHSNNFYQCLDGKLIVEFAELHHFAKADVTKVKQMLSNAVDTYRAPYDRNPDDHPRMSVFAGTTNEAIYLRDDTGARRFWPIRADSTININYVYEFRDQLFAEAVSVFRSENPKHDRDRTRSSWWNVPDDMAIEEQEDRRIRDPWQDDVERYVSARDIVATAEIIEGLFSIAKKDKTRIEEMRVTSILRLLGWERFTVRSNGATTKAWRRACNF